VSGASGPPARFASGSAGVPEPARDARPSALASWPEIAARLAGRRLALFLDYDGTLSPIAARPELATLPPATRAALARLAARQPVAVLSGRGRADVAALVGLPEIYYAGSHGFDIAGPPPAPGEPPLRHEVGEGVPERVARAAERLRAELGGIAGLLVEPKRFSIAVHYRLADERELPRITAAVDRIVAAGAGGGAKGWRRTAGKKVLELRPDVPWDKGRALLWLLGRLGLDAADVVPLYLGDDETDEDAFTALAARHGIGILVAEAPRPTAATYRLRDPGEVQELLERLADLG
jgi:trehalose 6-phosphate phosphatase